VRYGGAARAALLDGASQMAALIAPTLGPSPGTVAITRIVGGDMPEILDSGATIARRTIQLADPFANVGAMLVRHMVIRLFERTGDGTATAAVILRSLLRSAFRYAAAGGDLAALRRGIEHAARAAAADLRRQARPIDTADEIESLVRASVRDDEVAAMLGEIMESVGAEGSVVVEASSATHTSYEYLDGVQWDEGVVSAYFLEEAGRLLWPRVFCTDHPLERAEHVLPVIEACLATGEPRLFIVAPEVRDTAVGLLLANRQKGVLQGVLAARAPAIGAQRTRILEDIAILTGGRCVRAEAGERLEDVTAADLGRARQAWATPRAFGILGGQGNREAIRRRLTEARAELRTNPDDPSVRKRIEQRIGRLSGSGAVVRVGATTEAARDELTLRVEAALRSARLALAEGVVAGGGAALVAAGRAASHLELPPDERVGARFLDQALAEPMRTIARRVGCDGGMIVAMARERGASGWTFDAVRREWVDAWAGGLLDPCRVLTDAVEASVSAASSALATDALVRKRGRDLAWS
jgi:chaperonin GroEL